MKNRKQNGSVFVARLSPSLTDNKANTRWGRIYVRSAQFLARVNSVIKQLHASQMSTMGVLPMNQDVIKRGILVLVHECCIVGVSKLTRDRPIRPRTSPMVPNSNTSLILHREMSCRRQEALLSMIRLSTSRVWQRCPNSRRPVGRAH